MARSVDRRHVERLLACFHVVAIAAGAPALAAHCSPTGGAAPIDARDASLDAFADQVTPEADATPLDDASDVAAFDAAACYGSVALADALGPDAEELCDFKLPCGLEHSGLTTVGCTVVPAALDGAPQDPASVGFPTCYLLDGSGCVDGAYVPSDAGVTFECVGCPGGGGRRPPGYRRIARARGANVVGAYFAELAALEAASVRAFVLLARSLEALGAPRDLSQAARESARDEVRHARIMRRLAERFGGAPRRTKSPARAFSSIEALAKHNALEGCVRETHGALLNAWQATHAKDADVRAAMRQVADDELRHAALSWAIAEWTTPRVASPARIDRARRRAFARLARDASIRLPDALRQTAGLPDVQQAIALARGLAESLCA